MMYLTNFSMREALSRIEKNSCGAAFYYFIMRHLHFSCRNDKQLIGHDAAHFRADALPL